MRALGIDPGANLGWAVLESPHKMVACGLLRGHVKHGEHRGAGYARLRAALREVFGTYHPDVVFHETWVAHKGVYAAHELGAYQALIREESYNAGSIPCVELSVSSIKAFATGHGQADKAKMIKAARLLWPDAVFTTSDVADAAHIARLGLSKHP